MNIVKKIENLMSCMFNLAK